MGLSCLLIALLWGTASVILIPLALFLCLCCIGFTAEGIRLGSSAAFCMSCGDGETPCCVSCCQSLGAKGLSCCTLTCIFLATTIIFLFKCSSITEYYCESLTTNSTLCYNSTGNSCFTFFDDANARHHHTSLMGLSCLIIALLWGTGSVALIPLILCLCLTCIGYTPKGIRGGSPAACCMSCGEGNTPKCVSCGQSLGVKGLPCVALTFIFLVMTTIILLECPTITELYCDSLTTNSSLCYNSTGSSCFTFFGKGYCQVD